MSTESELIERLGLAEMAKRIGDIDKRLKVLESGFDRPVQFCQVKRTSDQSIATATAHYFTWQGADYNASNWWSSGQWVVTPAAGIYILTLNCTWAGNTTGYRQIGLYNNTDAKWYGIHTHQANSSASTDHMSIARVLWLGGGKSIGGYAYQTSGGNLNAIYADGYSVILGLYKLA